LRSDRCSARHRRRSPTARRRTAAGPAARSHHRPSHRPPAQLLPVLPHTVRRCVQRLRLPHTTPTDIEGDVVTVVFDPEIVTTEDGGREQRWPLPTDEDSLLRL